MIVAVDVGTSNVKAQGFVIIENEGCCSLVACTPLFRLASSAQPQVWFQQFETLFQQVMTAAAAANASHERRPMALVLSGMMQNVILVGEKEPNACILYNDAMFAKEANEVLVNRALDKRLKRETGNYKYAASVVAKLLQINRNQASDSRPRRHNVLFGAHSYIAWRLTGALACDLTTASTTGLLSLPGNTLEQREWLPEALLREIGIDNFNLPSLLSNTSAACVGSFTFNALQIPVLHGSGDLGSVVACVEALGLETHAYIGTSGWIATARDKSSSRDAFFSTGNAFTLAHPTRPSTHDVLAMPTTAAGFNAELWAKVLFASKQASVLDAHAQEQSTAKGEDSILYVPYLRGERAPIAMPNARAAFLGMHAENTSLSTLSRAVLEGVAFQYRWMAESLLNTEHAQELCLLGGGASSAIWCQIMSDVLQRPISRVKDVDDETVFGTACIALAWLRGGGTISAQTVAWERFTPESIDIDYDAKYKKWRRAVDLIAAL